MLVNTRLEELKCVNLLLHDGYTVGALNNLSRILTGGNEDGSDDVGGMGVETTDRSKGRGTVQYMAREMFEEGGHRSFVADVWAFGMSIAQVSAMTLYSSLLRH